MKQPNAAETVLHNYSLLFTRTKGLSVNVLLTDKGHEFYGKDTQPYEIYLMLNNIEKRNTKIQNPQTNGFVEQSNLTVYEEFFRIVLRAKLYESAKVLQENWDMWLAH